ncbi:MAG TPA: portal protein, partial [Vitreimonas sp.]|nr:portal protein [Vitreimonas sp.]
RMGLLPPVPAQLVDKEYIIEYESPITRALKMSQLTGITRTVEVLTPFAEVAPEMFDKFDFDKMAEYTAEQMEMPVQLLRTDKDVKKLRDARAAKQAQMEELAAADSMANTAAAGGKAMESMAKVKQMS